ncbi:hypothetical protein [Aeromonas veronii]|uniref:hypothetical protein n=1 Tax=Aeromonas veronii TaxID=654 RepID=UPI003BA1ADDB
MPITSLHASLIQLAGDRGAMLIAGEAIRSAVLDNFTRAAANLAGLIVDTLHPKVAARFDATSAPQSQLDAKLGFESGSVVCRVTPDFDLQLSLIYTGDISQTFSTLVFSVSNIVLVLSTDGSAIRFRLSDPLVTASFTDTPPGSRDAAVKASGIDVDDLLRIEGSFAYGTGYRLVSSFFGRLPALQLRELFPALDFAGDMELAVVEDSLAAIPDRMTIMDLAGCPQSNAAEGISVVPQSPDRPNQDSRSWAIWTQTRASQVSAPNFENPLTAVHLPRSLIDMRFGKISPAIAYRERDNGFIGYDVQITGAVKQISVSIDDQLGAVRVLLGFSLWGTLVADIELPTIGRQDLAVARFELPENNVQANIEALARLAVDSGGRLLVVTEISRLELGKARVVLDVFGRYLSHAGGKAAVAGMLLDGVIGRIIAHNIPPIVSQVIRDNLDRNFFVLTSLSGLSKYIDRLPNSATFSGNSDFALLGSNYLG